MKVVISIASVEPCSAEVLFQRAKSALLELSGVSNVEMSGWFTADGTGPKFMRLRVFLSYEYLDADIWRAPDKNSAGIDARLKPYGLYLAPFAQTSLNHDT